MEVRQGLPDWARARTFNRGKSHSSFVVVGVLLAGLAQVMMMSGGSINVAGDLLVAPGSAGQAAIGASAYASSFYMVRPPTPPPRRRKSAGPDTLSFFVRRRRVLP
jgi:hypothetical protein